MGILKQEKTVDESRSMAVKNDLLEELGKTMGLQQIMNAFKEKRKLPPSIAVQENYGEAKPLLKDLKENIDIIIEILGDPCDLVLKEFEFGSEITPIRMVVIEIEGLSNKQFIHDYVLKGLMVEIRGRELPEEVVKGKSLIDIVKDYSLTIANMTEIPDFKSLCERLINGSSILLLEGYDIAFALETKGWEDRGVTTPTEESVIRGPRDGFNETIRTNTMLIRRRIKDINLRNIERQIGMVTKTQVSVMYIEGIANNEIVQDLLSRLDRINVDAILESSVIEELIIDEPRSLFPTMNTTERPDKVAGNLVKGRIAIITDGTPIVLLVPAVFANFMASVEDYYRRSIFASFIRLLRFACFFIALLTPALYVSLTLFHQEMIPSVLLISIVAQRENVPFPALVEVLMMELTFEILREAGVRMPTVIGSAMSIVGALVLGEAAVNAGFVSNIMVIVVSITAICSLIFPEYNFSNPVRILRFVFILLAGIFGLYGVGLGMIFLTLHLCSLRSFGVPYMYPFAPLNVNALKDSLIRVPYNKLDHRPDIITGYDKVRQNDRQEYIKKESEVRED